ncbi:MAG: ATP-binding protein [Betaproteobacteria bacterium]|nr:ATP-binding protein [Betaproteobacteria bacterium]
MAKIKPWHQVIALRADIRSGELSQKEFAADLYDVMMDKNRSVYHDPKEFFALTYPTTRLRELARDVVLRLAGKSEKAVRQLQLTYGGGKTHALITLVHLVSDPDTLPKLPAIQEFINHIGITPTKARVAALVFDRLDVETGMDVKSPDGKVRRFKMPWSALAWQLGGEGGLKLLGSTEKERDTPPATNVMEDVLSLPEKDGLGTLVLLDEVLMWAHTIVSTDRAWIKKLETFFQCLTQAAGRVKRCSLVASLLASDPSKSDELGKQVEKALYDIFQRVADTGIQPVERQDVAEVLRRRLFTPESYTEKSGWKAQVVTALNGICDLDDQTKRQRSQEEARYLESFPFQPDLTDVLFEKWTQLEGFQRTRGVLRTFATALRDAEKWGDPAPLAGPGVFLPALGDDNLTDAARELATIARTEQYDGKRQDWQAILQGELKKAREIQQDTMLSNREVEQAVIATFMHSQPIGQRAQTRELMVMLGQVAPDKIELGKGLSRWADVSWYLDDTFTAEKDGSLPKVWRLGSKPNLRQMHYDARTHIAETVIEEVLEKEISATKKLSEGARTMGAAVHTLPLRPAEIEDDGEFHYAVLGPKTASDSGKPSAEAKRYVDETTAADRPRALSRNAVVLAVPSKDGIALARERVRDMLAWEQVREMLKSREDVDTGRLAQLEMNLRAARSEMASHIVMAYCIVVTVNDANEVAAFRLNVDNDALFVKIVNDKRARIESTAINAEALLPGGPFNLWQAGEKSRYVKDLVGAFASTARLPKMLNRQAILDTLLRGCEAGDFVLQVTRADKSQRTFWRSRPDDHALGEPSLEVVLPEAAMLVEIEPGLLAPNVLPELWKTDPLALGALCSYFSGKHYIQMDKGGYKEPMSIPGASPETVKQAVSAIVKAGRVWLVTPALSVLGEDVPVGLLTDDAALNSPPPPISPTDLLPEALPAAWEEPRTNAHLLHIALSTKFGRTLPWATVRAAIDEAFRLGLLERSLLSKEWPTDLGGAAGILIVVSRRDKADSNRTAAYGAKLATAELEAAEVQDLAEVVGDLMKAAAGQRLRFKVTVELGESTSVPQGVVDEVNRHLTNIKTGWKL